VRCAGVVQPRFAQVIVTSVALAMINVRTWRWR
jgi:hypothetical protein